MRDTEARIIANESRIKENETRIAEVESVIEPPQTVELYEGSDDPLNKEEKQNIVNKLGGDGVDSRIDTIINYDKDEGQFNISNVITIGDQVICKEWKCDKEMGETIENNRSANRNRSRSSRRFKNQTIEMDDTYGPSQTLISEEDESVERNPSMGRKTFNRHKFSQNVEN